MPDNPCAKVPRARSLRVSGENRLELPLQYRAIKKKPKSRGPCSRELIKTMPNSTLTMSDMNIGPVKGLSPGRI